MKIGLLHTGIREDERMILTRAKELGINIEAIDARTSVFSSLSKDDFKSFGLILQRCASTTKGNQALWFFEEVGIPIVNSKEISEVCRNKFATSIRLREKGVRTPDFAIVFSEKQALEAIEKMGGFPVVLKPVEGTSWGRLIVKVNDEDSLEAILEHKQTLGVNHQSFYIQNYIDKPGRDIRVYTVNSEAYAAIYRNTEHWITNTARGAVAEICELTEDIKKICKEAQDALGEGLLAIDLFETKEGLSVNEVNHVLEFKNVVKTTKIDIPGKILKYCLQVLNEKTSG